MREGMLHIRDVEGPKKTGSMETRLEAMEQQVFKCEGMVERGLNANHMMTTEFTNKHRIDANDIAKHLSRLYDRIDQLQAHIYDLQNQNCSFTILIAEPRCGDLATNVVRLCTLISELYLDDEPGCLGVTNDIDALCALFGKLRLDDMPVPNEYPS
ncbi:40S ribosomal protein S5-1 [Hordeum vulgare]|nr:40S ribosomal protein S5-1 [Hordeum vulgare]